MTDKISGKLMGRVGFAQSESQQGIKKIRACVFLLARIEKLSLLSNEFSVTNRDNCMQLF